MSALQAAIEQVLQHETERSDGPISAVFIPNNNRLDIEAVVFDRENLLEQVEKYFPPEHEYLEPVCFLPTFENPCSTTILAIYLSSDRSAVLYNNRASELFGTNISNNVLLFEINEGVLTTGGEVFKTTITELCDEVRHEGLFSTVFRSLKTTVLNSHLGSWLEGMNSTNE